MLVLVFIVYNVPCLLLQVHYNSHTGPVSGAESPTAGIPPVLDFSEPLEMEECFSDSTLIADKSSGVPATPASCSTTKKNSVKKANLYAWLSLPPLPEVIFFYFFTLYSLD